MSRKGFALLVLLLVAFAAMAGGCGGGGGNEGGNENVAPEEHKPYFPEEAYETVKTPVANVTVYAGQHNSVEVTQSDFAMSGLKIEIPAGTIDSDASLVFSNVINPPFWPEGYFFIRPFIEISGAGKLNSSVTATMPYRDEYLEEAGIANPNMLEVFVYFDDAWHKQRVLSIDRNQKVVTVELEAFGFISFGCRSFEPVMSTSAVDGTSVYSGQKVSPFAKSDSEVKPGDILITCTWGRDSEGEKLGWLPGHVGIYVGEKIDNNTGKRYNVIESKPWFFSDTLTNGVARTYHSPLSKFGDQYLGAFSPAFGVTDRQREIIVETAEFHVGTYYPLFLPTDFYQYGMVLEHIGKGTPLAGGKRTSMNCIGLVELALEAAGVNSGEGYFQPMDLMLPAYLYNKLRQVEDVAIPTKIEWATLTPNVGTWDTWTTLKAKVSGNVKKVYYEIEGTGYFNPLVNEKFNDDGLYDDEVAGDHIYTTRGTLGGIPGSSYQLRVYAIGASGITVSSELITVDVLYSASTNGVEAQSTETHSFNRR
jgi:hypothetical protein